MCVSMDGKGKVRIKEERFYKSPRAFIAKVLTFSIRQSDSLNVFAPESFSKQE